MRLGDLDALKEVIKANHYLLSSKHNSTDYGMFTTGIMQAIDNAPTVEPFEPDYVGAERLKARQRGYNEGYHNGMEMGKTLNPKIKQGEWIRSEETFEDLSGSFETYTRSTCSICNQANGWGEVPYCPWCGAKMEVKHDKHGETDPEQTG